MERRRMAAVFRGAFPLESATMAEMTDKQSGKATPWLAYIVLGAVLFIVLLGAYVYFSGGGSESPGTPPVNVTAPG